MFIKEASNEADSEIYLPGSVFSTGSFVALAGSPSEAQTQTIQHVLDAIANAAGCPVYIVKRNSTVSSRDVYSIMPDNYRGAYRYNNSSIPISPVMCTISREGTPVFFAPSSDNSKRIHMESGSFMWTLVTGDITPIEAVDMEITDENNFSFNYHGFNYVIVDGSSSIGIPGFSD